MRGWSDHRSGPGQRNPVVTDREGSSELCVLLGPCAATLATQHGPFRQRDLERLAQFQTNRSPDFALEFVSSPPRASAGLRSSSSSLTDNVLAVRYSEWFADFDLAKRRGRVFAPNTMVADNFLRTAAQILLLVTQTGVALHAACVSIDGRAVAISAPSGTGKTTTALRILGAEAVLIAEDIALIGGLEVGRPAVFSAPVRGGDGARPGPKATPLARIYGLRRAEVDGVASLHSREAMAVLTRNIAIGTRQPHLVLEALGCARTLLETTPVRRLDCTPDGPIWEVIQSDLADEPIDATEGT